MSSVIEVRYRDCTMKPNTATSLERVFQRSGGRYISQVQCVTHFLRIVYRTTGEDETVIHGLW
jgi:hypothetical protein